MEENLSNLVTKNNEYELGFMKEFTRSDGTKGIINDLDFKLANTFLEAQKEEASKRLQTHTTNITILVLVIVLVLMVMLIIYINSSTDITGIYYDKNGTKIDVYHNKTSGQIEIQSSLGNKSGLVKKINAATYGLYLDEDLLTESLEKMSQPIAAYADLKTGDITWKNDIWKLDKRGYIH